ncbi:succinate dehydrogenase assembly factor 2 [Thiohalobacter sp. IOR34]|uniref:FAD assembly factor SdhE n=1 Tax=Thiohalobacter sp. IOR34 TaxID=3057176 RepID=UPI0025AFE0BC|nr:succinate dehydrogenase assembly factor 2 [Thiohalobacter sp. IOR34]WJW76747.1 succinate dehydrogenase assembly factor 2 [Thiohalobacter sp. IOR34]
MAETPEQARLHWQCRRGMRELDLLLLGFLEQGYAALDDRGRAAFDTLLSYPDPLLLEILMGRQTPADTDVAHVAHCIRHSHRP